MTERSSVGMRPWLGLVALALAAMMDGVDAMIVTIAAPTISVELDTGLAELQWITTGYLLAYAASLLTAGKLGDRYGHRRVFLLGMVGFMASSVLVGLSQSITMMIAFRVLQGAFAASLLPAALAIIRITFPEASRKVAVGVFMGTSGLSAAAGPFLGGLVVEYGSWRWAFFVNVIGGAVALALTVALIRPTAPTDARRPLDAPGILLAAFTLAPLVLAINQVATQGWTGPVPVAGLLVTLICGVLFVLRERSTPHPVVPLSMFASRAFLAGNLVVLVGTGLLFAVWFYLALFLQNVQGDGPLRTGLQLLPIAAVGLVTAPLGGVLNQRLGPRLPLTLSILLFAVGLFGLTRITPDTGYAAMWPWFVLLGVSMSLFVPIGMEAVISSAPKRLAGVASGLGETTGSIGPALGVASAGTAISILVSGDLVARLTAEGVPAPIAADAGSGVGSVAQGTVPIPPGTDPAVAATITEVAHEAFTAALRSTLWAGLVLLLVLAPVIWVSMGKGVPEAPDDDTDTRDEGARDEIRPDGTSYDGTQQDVTQQDGHHPRAGQDGAGAVGSDDTARPSNDRSRR
jgi:EmrB/QacA subfamily drug resistance transporter